MVFVSQLAECMPNTRDSSMPRKPIVVAYGSNTSFQEVEARGQKLTVVRLPGMEKEIATWGSVCSKTASVLEACHLPCKLDVDILRIANVCLVTVRIYFYFICFISRIACHHYITNPYFYYPKSFQSNQIWSQRVYSHSRKVCHCNSSWHLLKVLVWRLEVKKKPLGLMLYSDAAIMIKKKLTWQWLCREERVHFSSPCHHNWEVKVAGLKTSSDITPLRAAGLKHLVTSHPRQGSRA